MPTGIADLGQQSPAALGVGIGLERLDEERVEPSDEQIRVVNTGEARFADDPLGATKSSRRYSVSLNDGVTLAPATSVHAALKASAVESFPCTREIWSHGASAVATSFANVYGSPLTSSTASLICNAAPTAPSPS